MNYKYGHYYDFSKINYFSEMNEVFSGIFDRSVKYYLNNRDGYEQKFALCKIVEYVQDLEKYLIGLINLGYVTTDNVNLVKDSFKNLDTIGLLNSSYHGGIYGITDSRRIEINPNLRNSNTLSASERTLLYISHEMGHRLHFGWSNRMQLNGMLADSQIKDCYRKLPNQEQMYIYSGFDMLDEALAQDRAEEIAYYFANRVRPQLSLRSTYLFNKKPFKTNYDYYGEFQELAIKFGKTLRNITKDDSKVLKQLGQTAIDNDFVKKIEYEYRSNNNLIDLFALIHAMGTIKEAAYEVFGMGTRNTILKSARALETFNSITNKIIMSKKPKIKIMNVRKK